MPERTARLKGNKLTAAEHDRWMKAKQAEISAQENMNETRGIPRQFSKPEEAMDYEGYRKGGDVAFRTPSGGVSTAARRQTEAKGEAMPGGRFPIRNTSDLSNAKRALGRANDKPAVRRWIDKRAKQLGEPPLGG